MKALLVFDIGGTSSRSGLFLPSDDTLLASKNIHTPFLNSDTQKSNYNKWIENLFYELTKEFRSNIEIEQIILGFPGPISSGKMYRTPTMLGANLKEKIDLHVICQSIWPGIPIKIINDVTALGYFYTAKGFSDFCLLTVGSGIGCKVFLSGKPIVGPNGRGGEIGHLKVCRDHKASKCDCGEWGHLGSISSGRGILNYIKSEAKHNVENFKESKLAHFIDGETIDNKSIVKAFLNDDAWVTEKIREASSYLANTIAGIHTSIGMETFIINGGYAVALGEKYRLILVKEAQKQCWNLGQDWNKMLILGNESNKVGLIGAGVYGKQEIH